MEDRMAESYDGRNVYWAARNIEYFPPVGNHHFVVMILQVIRDVLQEMPLADRPSTDQVPTKLNDSAQRAVNALISALGNDTLSAAELMGRMGLTHRPHFRQLYLTPALQSGLLERTIPDKPNSPHQRYRVAKKGR